MVYFDVGDTWQQGIYPLAGHLQDLEFGMDQGRKYDMIYMVDIYLVLVI